MKTTLSHDAAAVLHRSMLLAWYLRAGVAISDVSDYCGVSEAIIRRQYKHHLPGTYDRIFEAAPRFGKTGKIKTNANN